MSNQAGASNITIFGIGEHTKEQNTTTEIHGNRESSINEMETIDTLGTQSFFIKAKFECHQ